MLYLGTDLVQPGITLFHLFPPFPQRIDTDPQPATLLDLFLLAVQPQSILFERSVGARRCGGSEMVLVERDREGRVGREDERGVTFAPVPVRRQGGRLISIKVGRGLRCC